MSEKISKRILIGEIIIIIVPSALVLFYFTFLLVFSRIHNFEWVFLSDSSYRFDLLLSFCALLASVSIISALVISQKFLRHGKDGLDTIGITWWIMAFLGGAVAIASVIVPLFPPSHERSPLYWFRIEFEAFQYGLPMLVPLIHLLLEKHFRKANGVSL